VKPAIRDLIIAVDARTRFFIAAEAAPVGSVAQGIARREYHEAQAEALRIETELAEYVAALELTAKAARLDTRRS
jgi:hypothetical protein